MFWRVDTPTRGIAPRGRRLARRILLLVLVLLVASPALAKRELPSDSEHRGIVKFDPYEVFPENREGNGVYLEGRLLLTEPAKAITHVLPLVEEGRFLYVVRDEFGKLKIGVKMKDGDLKPRVTEVAPGIFFVIAVMNEVVYKKVYRIVQNNTAVDLLPGSKTADGVTAGRVGVLFYHIASMNRGGDGGQTDFNLRLHLVLFEEERLRQLDYPVVNTLPSLKLAWVDETSAKFTLADGREETLSIAQFQ